MAIADLFAAETARCTQKSVGTGRNGRNRQVDQRLGVFRPVRMRSEQVGTEPACSDRSDLSPTWSEQEKPSYFNAVPTVPTIPTGKCDERDEIARLLAAAARAIHGVTCTSDYGELLVINP